MPRILTPADIAHFRSRLCDVAAQLFSEQGQSGFNMRELAKRLGVSAMTPYRYFQDKDAILAEVRARAFARFADCLEEALAVNGGDPDTLANAYAQFAIQEQTQYRLMFDLTQPAGAATAPLAGQEQRARAAIVAHARQMTEQGAVTGDPELIGLLLWGTLHGIAALYLTGKLSGADFHLVLSNSVGRFRGGPIADRSRSFTLDLAAIPPSWAPAASYQPAAVAGE